MSYEAWRISFQSSEQAARSAYGSLLELQSRIAELEKDAARYRWARIQNNREASAAILTSRMNADKAFDEAMSREA